jgi:hypothetical protein
VSHDRIIVILRNMRCKWIQCAQQFSKLFSKLFSTDSVSIQFVDSAKLINSIRLWRIELIEFNNLRGKLVLTVQRGQTGQILERGVF